MALHCSIILRCDFPNEPTKIIFNGIGNAVSPQSKRKIRNLQHVAYIVAQLTCNICAFYVTQTNNSICQCPVYTISRQAVYG